MVTKSIKKHSSNALIAVLLIGAAASANAVVLSPIPTPEVAPSLVLANQPGTVVGYLQDAFGPSIGGNPPFTGILTTYAVRRTSSYTDSVGGSAAFAAGGLDFYYQIQLTSVGTNPIPDIEEWNFSPIADSFGTYSVEALNPLSASLTGLTLGAFPAPAVNGNRTPAVTAYDGNVIKFDFTSGGVDTRLTPTTPRSVWQILHTNATNFTTIGASVQDSGVAPSRTLAPVPEPSTALFGAALVGMTAFVRRRKTSRA